MTETESVFENMHFTVVSDFSTRKLYTSEVCLRLGLQRLSIYCRFQLLMS